MDAFAPEYCHDPLLDAAPRALAFTPGADFTAWRAEVDTTLRRLVGVLPEPAPLDLRVEYELEHDEYLERRFLFSAEAHADVPCHLLIPKTKRAPYPVVVCLQGHSPGMHISLGRAKNDSEAASIAGGRDFGVQAVREGYAALVLEQRCFGEREDRRPSERRSLHNRCHHASMTALLLGRTMIGERTRDVSRAIDALAAFPEVDLERIACMGNSGGGTTTFYAACLDPRIRVVMPSCVVCTFKDSIGRIDHCHDNYLPGALRYFEMGDLASLIAPRPLVVVAGEQDPIFPLHGVREAYATIEGIYAAAGAPENCRLVVGDGGHRFYPDDAWPVFHELSGWLSEDAPLIR
jgi:dienelactone hydrolase